MTYTTIVVREQKSPPKPWSRRKTVSQGWSNGMDDPSCVFLLENTSKEHMKTVVRRAIELVGLNKLLELSKATAVKTDKNMIHLDELSDGTWRLIYNGNMIPDFTKLTSIKFVRIEAYGQPEPNGANIVAKED